MYRIPTRPLNEHVLHEPKSGCEANVLLASEGLRQDVRDLIIGRHVLGLERAAFDLITNEMMTDRASGKSHSDIAKGGAT